MCPVRALKGYMDHTKIFHATDALFVSYGEATLGRPVSRQHLAHWVVDLIALVYVHAGVDPPLGLGAHPRKL